MCCDWVLARARETDAVCIVKDSWNTQIMNAAQSLVKVDIGSKAVELWNKHVVDNIKESINKN